MIRFPKLFCFSAAIFLFLSQAFIVWAGEIVNPEDWDAVIEAAKKEGEINFYGYGPADMQTFFRGDLARQIKKDYGITLNYHHGSWFDTLELMKAEKNKPKGSIDVAYMWSKPFSLALEAEVLMDRDIVSEIPNGKRIIPRQSFHADMFLTHGRWVPVDRYLDFFWYNKRHLKWEDVPKSYDELLSWCKKHPGKFG